MKIVRFKSKEIESLREKNSLLKIDLEKAMKDRGTNENVFIAHEETNKKLLSAHQNEIALNVKISELFATVKSWTKSLSILRLG